MEKFIKGQKVRHQNQNMEVIRVYNGGQTADLQCELIPFMPVTCLGVHCGDAEPV